jgi:hypothetical protein
MTDNNEIPWYRKKIPFRIMQTGGLIFVTATVAFFICWFTVPSVTDSESWFVAPSQLLNDRNYREMLTGQARFYASLAAFVFTAMNVTANMIDKKRLESLRAEPATYLLWDAFLYSIIATVFSSIAHFFGASLKFNESLVYYLYFAYSFCFYLSVITVVICVLICYLIFLRLTEFPNEDQSLDGADEDSSDNTNTDRTGLSEEMLSQDLFDGPESRTLTESPTND